MSITKRKTSIVIAMIMFCAGVLFTGCDGSGSNSENDAILKAARASTYSTTSKYIGFDGIISGFKYPAGVSSADMILSDDELKAEYEEWKTHYVTEDGACDPNPSDSIKYYRVKRDQSSSYDTVSEGIAYGMLLAVYFDDRVVFDGLYRYCLLHLATAVDDTGKYYIPTGLMHWKVRADGKNISEFRLTVPHGIVYLPKDQYDYYDIDETDPTRLRVYYVDKADDQSNYGGSHAASQVSNIDSNTNYLRSTVYARKPGSATDADVDIAAALCMASRRWSVVTDRPFDYTTEAAKTIRNIIEYDVSVGTDTTKAFLKNGSLWGSNYCWNPSYFSPAWWRVYAKLISDNASNKVFTEKLYVKVDGSGNRQDIYAKGAQHYIDVCNGLLTNMYKEMAKIDRNNGSAGLYPDWCETANVGGNAKKCADWNNASDRRYYLDEDPAIPNVDGMDDKGDPRGVISFGSAANGSRGDGYNMMSFNFYYDGVRVPWRLTTDYSWYKNKTAELMVIETAEFFRDKIDTYVDGYSITGGSWVFGDRDGFNSGIGGLNHSRAFEAMLCIPTLAHGDPGYIQDFYDRLKIPVDPIKYTESHNYYETTLRMLSLLYMSGKFFNFYDIESMSYDRDVQRPTTIGPVTVDTSYADYGVYGTDRLSFNDRAKLFNNDQTDYGKIGTGIWSSTGSNSMTIGNNSYVGDVVCGLKTLDLRGPVIGKCILAREKISGAGTVQKIKVSNFTKDPGYLRVAVDSSKFTPSNDNRNVEPGNSLTLAPGKYGSLTLKGRNSITLSSGVYHFSSIVSEPDVTFYFDTTSGPVQIFVKGDFMLKSRTKMLQKGTTKGADPSQILVVVNTSNPVYLASTINWRGTLIAMNTSELIVDMGNSSIKPGLNDAKNPSKWETVTSGGEAFGAFWAKNVTVHQDTAVYTVPYEWNKIRKI